jgi:hypothetical protein
MIKTFTFVVKLDEQYGSMSLNQSVIGRYRLFEVLTTDGFAVTHVQFQSEEEENFTEISVVVVRTRSDARDGRVHLVVIEKKP